MFWRCYGQCVANTPYKTPVQLPYNPVRQPYTLQKSAVFALFLGISRVFQGVSRLLQPCENGWFSRFSAQKRKTHSCARVSEYPVLPSKAVFWPQNGLFLTLRTQVQGGRYQVSTVQNQVSDTQKPGVTWVMSAIRTLSPQARKALWAGKHSL